MIKQCRQQPHLSYSTALCWVPGRLREKCLLQPHPSLKNIRKIQAVPSKPIHYKIWDLRQYRLNRIRMHLLKITYTVNFEFSHSWIHLIIEVELSWYYLKPIILSISNFYPIVFFFKSCNNFLLSFYIPTNALSTGSWFR